MEILRSDIWTVSPMQVVEVLALPGIKEYRDWAIDTMGLKNCQYRGKGQRVGVIDTGCDLNHRDLKGRVTGANFIQGNTEKPAWRDVCNHGTFVTGEIVARQDKLGVVGAAPEATAFSARVLYGDNRDSRRRDGWSSIAKAIRACVQEGCGVINMSLGGPGYSQDLKDAVDEAANHGVITVAAAGNERLDGSLYKSYPASFENVVSVAAANKQKLPAWFSTMGRGTNRLEQPEVAVASLEYYWGCIPGNNYGKMIGTCLRFDTPVLTDQGIVPIGDMRVGMRVWSADVTTGLSRWETCTGVMSRGIRPLCKLRTKHNTLYVTPDHVVPVARQFHHYGSRTKCSNRPSRGAILGIDWKPVSELKVGDLMLSLTATEPDTATADSVVAAAADRARSRMIGRAPVSCNHTLPATVTPELCQLVGAYLGDGYLMKDNRRKDEVTLLRLCIGDAGPNYAKLMSVLDPGADFTKSDEGVQWEVSGTLWPRFFDELGINHPAEQKRLPSWVWQTSRKCRLALLAGIADSDGTIDSRGRLGVELSSRGMIDDLRHLCWSVGLAATNVFTRTRPNYWAKLRGLSHHKQVTTSYHFSVVGLADRLHEFPCRHPDKLAKLQKAVGKSYGLVRYAVDAPPIDDTRWESVLEISNDVAAPVYDIEVASTSVFCADGLLVHNSMASPLLSAAALLWREAMVKAGKLPAGPNVLKEFRAWLQRCSVDTNRNGWDPELGYGVLLFKDPAQ